MVSDTEEKESKKHNKASSGLLFKLALWQTSTCDLLQIDWLNKLFSISHPLLHFEEDLNKCQTYLPNAKCFQVRRTRISERMRKLQELVPNMDKVESSLAFPYGINSRCDDNSIYILSPCSKQTHQTCWIWLLNTLKTFRNKSRYINGENLNH